MGIVKFTETAPQIVGSVGGTTYSSNAAGPFVRRRQKPVSPKTGPQCRQSADLGHSSATWLHVLSDANRVAWNALGAATTWFNRLGEEYHPTGHNLFVRSATILLYYGNTPITAPPVDAAEGPYEFTIALDGSSDIVLTDIDTCDDTIHGYIMVWWSKPTRASRYCSPSRWTYLKTISFQTIALPETLVAAVDAPTGYRYHFRFKVSRSAGTVGIPNDESLLNP